MSDAKSGHGTLVARAPNATPALFTTIAELDGDITWPELTRAATETSPHNATIDRHVVSNLLQRGEFTFRLNFIHDDPTHNHLTGIYQSMADKAFDGWRLRGPGGSSGDDEWIFSGAITAIAKVSPVREGAISADVTIRPDGPMWIDGVLIGT